MAGGNAIGGLAVSEPKGVNERESRESVAYQISAEAG